MNGTVKKAPAGGRKGSRAPGSHEPIIPMARRLTEVRSQLDDVLVKPTRAQKSRAMELAAKYEIDPERAYQIVHALNQLEALALQIAFALDWEHMGDAITHAEWVAGLSEIKPDDLKQEFEYRHTEGRLANAYIAVRRVADATERGEYVFAVGHLANVARHLLGDSVRQHVSTTNSAKATKRWSWLEEVQEEVANRRAADKARAAGLGRKMSRAKSLDQMLDEIRIIYDRKAAENNAAKLTPSRENALRLLEKWCRTMGID